MGQICYAATISWALVFDGPPPAAYPPLSCFAEQVMCEMAAMGARTAIALDNSDRSAYCKEQPASKPPYPLLPYVIR